MGARSTYHVIVIHQIHLPRITLNRAHERLCSLHPLIDRRLAQSLHLCCLKSPLNAPDLQQWVWCKLGVLRSRLFSHFVVFRNHNSNRQIFASDYVDNLCDLWQMERCRESLFENSPGRCYCSKKSLLVSHMPCQYSTALYFCVLGMLEIDDQCRGPSIKEKDHLSGWVTK